MSHLWTTLAKASEPNWIAEIFVNERIFPERSEYFIQVQYGKN